MSLTRTRSQIRDDVRKFANVQGTTALLRHPDADLNDYINRGLSRLRFLLTQANPDQRYLATSSGTTTSGTTVYSLPSDFGHLISLDLEANGVKHWLQAYELNERPALTTDSTSFAGIPFTYRLRGGNVELLPEPTGTYTYTLFYVPHTTELASDGATLDTVNRLDDYVIAYAAQLIAIKDKNWDLKQACAEKMAELNEEVRTLGRDRDQNSPPRVIDVYMADRWGRMGRRRRA